LGSQTAVYNLRRQLQRAREIERVHFSKVTKRQKSEKMAEWDRSTKSRRTNSSIEIMKSSIYDKQ